MNITDDYMHPMVFCLFEKWDMKSEPYKLYLKMYEMIISFIYFGFRPFW